MDQANACPSCGGVPTDGRRIICAMRRKDEPHPQMRERSGPQYELAAERSRIASAAYRAACRPPKGVLVIVGSTGADGGWHGEQRWYLARSERGEMVAATPEQVAAWAKWVATLVDRL